MLDPLQVSNRADRMGLGNAQDNIYLYSATQMSEILRQVISMRPRAVIVDSIQTVYLEDVTGSAGSVSQVRVSLCHINARGKSNGFTLTDEGSEHA